LQFLAEMGVGRIAGDIEEQEQQLLEARRRMMRTP